MTSVGVRELKANASELIRRVREEGEIIEISYYGKIVARLIPAKKVELNLDELSDLWAEMDRLAKEVGENWSGSTSAVDAVREGRRAI